MSGSTHNTNIIGTQPRRMSATSLAECVADEMCNKIGDIVGYHARMESRKCRRTKILFCTTGVMLRRLQDDPTLEGVSVVIVDEVHERQWQIDFLLIALRELIRTKRKDLQIATDVNRIMLESQLRQNACNNNDQQQILLGEWTVNDACSLWIETGIIDNKLCFKFPSNVHVIKMHADASKDEHALQLPSSSSSVEKSTTFTVINLFSKSQRFYLNFVVSHPNH